MSRPKLVVRAVRALNGRGVGYEPQPLGGQFRTREVYGYFVDLRAKTQAGVALDALLPASLAQLALGWWERAIGGETGAAGAFDTVVRRIHATAVSQDGRLLWPYDVDVPKYGITGRWFSAMAQGQMASVLVRAAIRGDSAAEEAARAAVVDLIHGEGPLRRMAPEGPVLQEAPSSPPSDILNGWLYALWGLHDVAVGLGDLDAARAWHLGVEAVRARVELYDTGSWSLYSLAPGRFQDVAHPFYHRLHVTQLRATARTVDAADLDRVAARWEAYDTARGRRRALWLKAVGGAARVRRL
jgi:heparosan-N-sulfate-glucuronate 5-epimerase